MVDSNIISIDQLNKWKENLENIRWICTQSIDCMKQVAKEYRSNRIYTFSDGTHIVMYIKSQDDWI
jgi:hypothetical protein